MLCSPAVGCALLLVVQVLRFCAPFRQSGVASFVNFFSSLALLAVILSLFPVFWRRLLQHYFVVVYCSEVDLLHLQPRFSTCVPSWSLVRGRCSGSSAPKKTTTWSAACEDWFRFRALLSVSLSSRTVSTLVRVFIAASDSGQPQHIRYRRLLHCIGGLQHHCVVCATA